MHVCTQHTHYIIYFQRQKKFAHFHHARMPEPVHAASISDAINTHETQREKKNVFVQHRSILWVISGTFSHKRSPFPRDDRLNAAFCIHSIVGALFSRLYLHFSVDASHRGLAALHFVLQFGISFGFCFGCHRRSFQKCHGYFVVASLEVEYYYVVVRRWWRQPLPLCSRSTTFQIY